MAWHVEKLPDGSAWGAILRGPILMGKSCGTERLDGIYAQDGRMGHVAWGPLVEADKVEFREADAPLETSGLVPFYTLHDCRYQIYWEFVGAGEREARLKRRAAEAAAERQHDERTLDRVRPGEQQPETEHDFEGSSDSETGFFEGRHWRHGHSFAYTLDPQGSTPAALEMVYWGADRGRVFDVIANGVTVGTVKLDGSRGRKFFTETYLLPEAAVRARPDGKIRVQFKSQGKGLAGGLFDLRLMKAE